MKDTHYCNIFKQNILQKFLKDEQGAYTVIMALISIILISFVALIVDSTGILVDKARFNQGMEQAGLFLVAENNEYRKNQEHYDVNRYKNTLTKEEKKKFPTLLAAQQDKRNKEMITELVRTYYLPHSYNPSKINDEFTYKCGRLKKNGTELKSVACEVHGEFDRPSWLYLTNNDNSKLKSSFDKTVKIKSDVYVQKNLDVIPLDVMLVLDLTGSMTAGTNGQYTPPPNRKIDILRNVVKEVSQELLDENNIERKYNRIAFTSFAFGAQQRGNINECYLPYETYPSFKTRYKEIIDKYKHYKNSEVFIQYNMLAELVNNKQKYINFEKTVSNIHKFTGNDLDLDLGARLNKGHYCLKNDGLSTTSKKWYTFGEQDQISSDFEELGVQGSTLSSPGLLIGANLLFDKNKDSEVDPKKLGVNTKRILLLMTDGVDEFNTNHKDIDPGITTTLIDKGMCDAIRKKIDTLQDHNYDEQPTKIAFVAFAVNGAKSSIGLKAAQRQMDKWEACVGHNNMYFAKNKDELLQSFRAIIGLTEEVGHAATERPNF